MMTFGPFPFGVSPSSDIAEGYACVISAGVLASQRRQYVVSLTRLWANWCVLLMSPPDNDIETCLPN
jgi:hypothetical protein